MAVFPESAKRSTARRLPRSVRLTVALLFRDLSIFMLMFIGVEPRSVSMPIRSLGPAVQPLSSMQAAPVPAIMRAFYVTSSNRQHPVFWPSLTFPLLAFLASPGLLWWVNVRTSGFSTLEKQSVSRRKIRPLSWVLRSGWAGLPGEQVEWLHSRWQSRQPRNWVYP